MEIRKKPYKTSELFESIMGILKEKKLVPACIDYAIPERENIPVFTYEFGFRNNLDFGGNEGIYLDLGISRIKAGSESGFFRLGTIKTLDTDIVAMESMAKLLGDFIYYGAEFVNENIDDFTWQGYNVSAYEKEKYLGGYEVASKENALAKKDYFFNEARCSDKVTRVVIRDNSSRSSQEFEKEE